MAGPDEDDERQPEAARPNARRTRQARRRAVDELREHSEWLRVTLASIGDAVVCTDADGQVTLMNGVAESLTGWPEADALGHPLPDIVRLVDERSGRPIENPALRALQRGTAIGLEHGVRLVSRDGRERPIDDSAAPIRAADGRVLGSVLIFRDITARARAERALRESEERLRLATSAAELGIWVWHLGEDRLTWEDARPNELFALPPDTRSLSATRLVDDLVHADDRPRFERALASARERETGLQFLGRFRRPDGALRWIELTGRLRRAANGTPDVIVGTVADVTARQQVQEQVRQTAEVNAKFRAIFDQGAQFAGMLTVEGIVVEVNRLSLEACGFTRADVIGKPFWECGWWNQSPAVMALVEAGCAEAAKGRLFQRESAYFLADGRERQVHVTIAPVTDDDGRILFLSPTGTDITERVTAQDALRESEQRFRLMADAAPVLIWISGMNRGYTWFNRSWLEFVGRPMGHEVGDGWTAHLHPDDVTGRLAAFADAFDRRDPFSMEYRLRRYDGEFRWLLDHGTPRYASDGAFAGYIGSCVDITERKRGEEALRASQAESDRQRRVYEAILTNTPDLAYVFDLSHRFIYANEGLLAMLGLTSAEAMGKTCLELGYEPWHAAMHDREIDQVVATRQPVRGDVPFTGTFGRRIYEYIFVPVLGARGEVEAVAGTTRDVTERNNAEAEREALLASERSARAEAERASLVKEEFLAMLSHELRTPLNAVVGWTQLLKKRPPSPQTLEQGLAVIDRNARMQAQLIADLLDMSRIMSGKMRIHVERVELRVVIEAALESARAAADAREVTIQTELQSINGLVMGDPVRLQQVVWNLLSNAVKFTPKGGRVLVTLAPAEAHVEVTVRDTGKGIQPEFLPHVFERFRQADHSAAREHGGLGLGLAIVKQLVDLHGGSVEVQSEGPDRGATFMVRLPLASAETVAPTHRDARSELALSPMYYDPPDLAGITVLVVDDAPDARELVRRVLDECHARVVVAGSASEAMSALERERPDVILSDIGMPHRDGYAFMNAVRRSGIRIPAAALTAFARSEDRTRALHAGFQTHIAKPVEPAELLATVAALVHKTVKTPRADEPQ